MTLLLEAVDVEELRRVLTPFRSRLDDVRVFGSRATGRARPTSDLDLVIYGADETTLLAIKDALEESLLPMTADVLAYETLTSSALKQHVDRVAKPLWDGDAQ